MRMSRELPFECGVVEPKNADRALGDHPSAAVGSGTAERAVSNGFHDVYQTITDQILGDLERGVKAWAPSWSTIALLPRRSTGELYRGINVVLLWIAAAKAGYANPNWLTFNQAKALGASVRKGQKATRILFFDRIVKDDTREGHEGEQKSIAFAKTYAVFNAEQIDGLPESFATVDGGKSDFPAREFFDAVGANVQTGPQPLYQPGRDCVQMPSPCDFVTVDAYVATLAHELVHWTGHRSRLDRDFSGKGTEAYAVEELVAEVGAAFLCATLGVATGERADHASYIAAYVRLLRDDKRLFVRAVSAAQKAVDFLHARAAGHQAVVAA